MLKGVVSCKLPQHIVCLGTITMNYQNNLSLQLHLHLCSHTTAAPELEQHGSTLLAGGGRVCVQQPSSSPTSPTSHLSVTCDGPPGEKPLRSQILMSRRKLSSLLHVTLPAA